MIRNIKANRRNDVDDDQSRIIMMMMIMISWYDHHITRNHIS